MIDKKNPQWPMRHESCPFMTGSLVNVSHRYKKTVSLSLDSFCCSNQSFSAFTVGSTNSDSFNSGFEIDCVPAHDDAMNINDNIQMMSANFWNNFIIMPLI